MGHVACAALVIGLATNEQKDPNRESTLSVSARSIALITADRTPAFAM